MFVPGVEPVDAVRAAELLGWPGLVVGPVHFGGVRFLASIEVDEVEHERRQGAGIGPVVDRSRLNGHDGLRPPARLIGCLVRERNHVTAVRQASLLAGYASRAVLVDANSDVVATTVDAAMLDQGVVHVEQGLLLGAGPRVAGARFNAREWELLETVYAAWLEGAVTSTP
ncbi:hypothetical protein [Tenggerimyces flavus]|uniref:Uncharacterized protein n=1 Tax=Tenggerimyces flavus TaxID=1708749 RepID=A0ABV7YLF9_9ACTN|nr:hypothetical protein [Tenggerimyces flavus]MBM7784799.1 hypothetical protein [Tenggerimyces flavus]